MQVSTMRVLFYTRDNTCTNYQFVDVYSCVPLNYMRLLKLRKYGLVDEWMDGCMDGWIGGWHDGWVHGWMDGWVDERMDGWMGGWIDV